MHMKKISTSLFQVFAIVSISVSAYAWQISPQEQAKRDTERKNILNKELSAEQSTLARLTTVLQQAISGKQPTQAIALDIARHKGNIDSLNKELGIGRVFVKHDVSNDVNAHLVLPKVAKISDESIFGKHVQKNNMVKKENKINVIAKNIYDAGLQSDLFSN
jgi:hypothetical protein